jgi:hypothetical protein
VEKIFNSYLQFFAYYFLKLRYTIFKSKKVMNKLQNRKNQGFFSIFA